MAALWRCFPRQRAAIEVAGIAAVNTPDSISRHWPESSIKSSQANAGGECGLRAMRRRNRPPGMGVTKAYLALQ